MTGIAALVLLAAASRLPAQLSYHGGRVVHHPRIHLIYWDNNWDGDNAAGFSRSNIEGWLKSFAASNYFQTAGQYTDGNGGVSSGSFEDANGSFFPLLPVPYPQNPGSVIDSLDIHLWLTEEIEMPGTGVPYPCSDDDLYVVLLPPGTNIDNVLNSTCGSFGAYHLFAPILVPPFVCDLTGGIKLSPYVVVPVICANLSELANTNRSDIYRNPNNFYTDFDILTENLSHEIIEACTDPLDSFITSLNWFEDLFLGEPDIFLGLLGALPGWYDGNVADLFTQSEAADQCEQHTADFVWLNNSIVAPYYSNGDGFCAAGPGVVTTLTLKQIGVPLGTPVLATLDSRSPDIGSNQTWFQVNVATGATYSYGFPAEVDGPPGTRYVTSAQPGSVTITNQTTEEATYTPQYFVTVVTSPAAAASGNASLTPSQWYDAGPFTLTADQYVSIDAGDRYAFQSWNVTGGLGSGDNDFALPFGLAEPITATANYQTQHLVSFNQSGIPSGVPWNVTVNGTAQAGPYSNWFNDQSQASYSYQSPVPDTTPGVQYMLTGSTPSSPLTVTAPVTVTGSYKTQDLLTVKTSGLGANPTSVYNSGSLIGTASDGSPLTVWFDQGTALSLSADALVLGSGGVACFFQSLSPTPPATLTAPFTTTALYETMDQLINDALNGGGVYGSGAGGIATTLHQDWATVTADLAAGNYAAALGDIRAFIQFIQAQTGKSITSATATTLEKDALLVYHAALCKGVAAGQISSTSAANDYSFYSGLVTSLGGTPLPPCS